ncbi:MAG: DNA-binding protein [Candidatus Freyarchaeota archaeon]|nr:DNA-binding protein [Candidatus Jordarchaeia archaeon]MBS7270114.1 DNA-binding protein [Candidatus Jordarchaeia archaeon]MBS7280806.1 DNA-binding protein [Candidatus Jordarchaeia archaeon]
MLQLQQQIAEAQRQERAQREYETQKQAVLRQILTPEARSRLTNLKIVKPDFADQIELQLIQLAQAGRITSPLTDEQLKNILRQLQERRRDIKVKYR